MALACAAWPGAAWATQGDSRTTIFVGSTEIDIGNAFSTGTTLGAKWAYEVRDDLEWSLGGAYTATDGQQVVAGQTYTIHADTTSLQSGLTYYFNRHPSSLLVPFLGIGLAALNYDVDYRYPGSLVGKTSGVAPGAFGQAGIELWLAR
ncbi:MAG TPA: hypothetical protein VL359_17400, partial [bacterium]|nr:hypothetical protein [bacterium]